MSQSYQRYEQTQKYRRNISNSIQMIDTPQNDQTSSFRPISETSQRLQTKSQRIENKTHQIRGLRLHTILILLILILASSITYYWRQIQSLKAQISTQKASTSPINILQLPKILWMYTEHSLEAQKMLEQVMGHYYIEKAIQSQWEVIIVNSKTVYDYLSPEITQRITYTMQHMLIEEKVNDLLRLALLIENGGIVIRVTEAFPLQGFNWLSEYFILEENQHQQRSLQNVDLNKLEYEALLFKNSDKIEGQLLYQDFFLAAVKNSQLIVDTFEQVSRAISTGKFSFTFVKENSFTNYNMKSVYAEKLTRNVMCSWLNLLGEEHYKVKVILATQKQNAEKMKILTDNQIIGLLKKQKTDFENVFGQSQHFIYFPAERYRSPLQDELQKVIDSGQIGSVIDSYWSDLLSIPYNQKLYEPVKPRNVHYCILDAQQFSDFNDIKRSFQSIKDQTYKQWTLVYFARKIKKQYLNYINEQKRKGFDIIIGESSHSIGRNYQIGIIKLCPTKSFILVLKQYQRLAHHESLKNLVDTIRPRNVLGAFVPLNVSGQIKSNTNEYQDYKKVTYNGISPRYEDLNLILNHLRVFHSDCYKIIPQFQLRTPQNQYYEDRFVFLQIFINMVKRSINRSDTTQVEHRQRIKWLIKYSRHIFDVPFFIKFHNEVLIQTDQLQQVNKTVLEMNFFKVEAYSMLEGMDHLVQNGQNMKQFAIFNPGNQYEPYTQRKNKTERIPKIIHQIWVGGQLPEGKRLLMKANRKLYPDFQHKLWKNQNITRENFPLSYDLIQNLFKVNQFTRYSKLATVADVMRHEIMYRQGGFYMDSSMKLFNNVFYQWLSYRVVIPTLQPMHYRWIESMCLFANQPKYPGLLRIISYQNTNNYNIFLSDAMYIAGPYDFRQYIQGYDEYDPDVLIMGFDTFYPMDYRLTYSYFHSYCAVRSEYVKQGDNVVYKFQDKWDDSQISMIENCAKYYPYSFGKEVSAVGGGTWQIPN